MEESPAHTLQSAGWLGRSHPYRIARRPDVPFSSGTARKSSPRCSATPSSAHPARRGRPASPISPRGSHASAVGLVYVDEEFEPGLVGIAAPSSISTAGSSPHSTSPPRSSVPGKPWQPRGPVSSRSQRSFRASWVTGLPHATHRANRHERSRTIRFSATDYGWMASSGTRLPGPFCRRDRLLGLPGSEGSAARSLRSSARPSRLRLPLFRLSRLRLQRWSTGRLFFSEQVEDIRAGVDFLCSRDDTGRGSGRLARLGARWGVGDRRGRGRLARGGGCGPERDRRRLPPDPRPARRHLVARLTERLERDRVERLRYGRSALIPAFEVVCLRGSTRDYVEYALSKDSRFGFPITCQAGEHLLRFSVEHLVARIAPRPLSSPMEPRTISIHPARLGPSTGSPGNRASSPAGRRGPQQMDA